jgi:hypothetical protein
MYICLNKIEATVKKGKEIKTTPILVPIGDNTTFFMSTQGTTKVLIVNTEFEIAETLLEIMDLISHGGMLIINTDIFKKKEG